MKRMAVLGLVVCVLGVSACPGDPVVGWRTDGSGMYPQAKPPTEWAADKNVVWKTEMPSWTNATPVIVGEKIFVCAEPTTLVCVRKADGEELWNRSHTYAEIMTPQDKAQAKQDKAKVARINKETVQPLRKEMNTARAALKKSPKDETLRRTVNELNRKIKEEQAKLAAFRRWERPPTHASNGYSSATPVSDGQVVAAVFSNGVAACYDLEGNRKWIKLIEKPPHNWGFSSSPALFADKLIVHINAMVALDVATGKEAWRVKKAVWRWGSPIVTKVGRTDVLITAAGDIVRLSDGKLLVGGLCKLAYSSPVLQDGVAYFIQSGGKAVELTAKGTDDVQAEPLWTTKPKKDRYYASPVLHDGLIYAVTRANVFSVIDAKTGQVVSEKTLGLGGGTTYPSLTLAGGHLFVSSDNGTTLVLEPGRDWKEFAKNKLGRFRSSPVFEGKRMYLRSYKFLYCFGQ